VNVAAVENRYQTIRLQPTCDSIDVVRKRPLVQPARRPAYLDGAVVAQQAERLAALHGDVPVREAHAGELLALLHVEHGQRDGAGVLHHGRGGRAGRHAAHEVQRARRVLERERGDAARGEDAVCRGRRRGRPALRGRQLQIHGPSAQSGEFQQSGAWSTL